MNKVERPYFKHFIIELSEESENLNSIVWIRQKIETLLSSLKIKHINSIYHEFSPTGISLVYILSSSHIAIHTWPENNYLHIDMLTCSQNIELKNIEDGVDLTFSVKEVLIHELNYCVKFDNNLIKIITDSFKDGVIAKGYLEVLRSIQQNKAKLVIIGIDVNSKKMVQEIKRLCNIYKVPLVIQLDKSQLGRLVGLEIPTGFVSVKVSGLNKSGFNSYINLVAKAKSQ